METTSPLAPHACPCCGHRTLDERAAYLICPVCFWEDDGQDDVDAHLALGGPNRTSLWQARTNFLQLGASEPRRLPNVRPASVDEPVTRRWPLLDDTAVDLVPFSDLSPWGRLHDGEVTAVARTGERVSLTVEIPYLTSRIEPPCDHFRVELLGCTLLEFVPYDQPPVSGLDELAEAGINLVGAAHQDGVLLIWGSLGTLHLRYQHLALFFPDGTPLAFAALDQCARDYWESWRRHHQK